MILSFVSWAALFFGTGDGICQDMTTYEGRVINADTLEPIEGARVVAIWMEWKGGGMLSKIRFKDARECLTDQDGEWAFEGPTGGSYPDDNGKILLSFLTGYQLYPPHFYVYKNWYAGFGESGAQPRGFLAKPHQNPESGMEGIVLLKFGDTEEERKIYREMNPFLSSTLLVPIENPEIRLRNLDFDFEYAANTEKVPISELSDDAYRVYGLKKSTVINEVTKGTPSLPVGACKKLPITCKGKSRAVILPPVTTMGGSHESDTLNER